MKYEDHIMEEEENTHALWWSEWAEEAKRMDQITKKEKEEILARLEVWEKENKAEELELEKEEAKEIEARWEEDARTTSTQDGVDWGYLRQWTDWVSPPHYIRPISRL